MEHFACKLEAFRITLQAARLEGLKHMHVDCETNRLQCATKLKLGKKYVNVDVGGSGAYMVVLETGEIFGIKSYGVIHRGHSYGTLDTIADYDWSGYQAHRIVA